MKEKKINDKKIIFSLVFVLFLYVFFGFTMMSNRQDNEKTYGEVLGVNINNAPVIEKILLNKTKYAPGDEMLITVESKKAKSINVFIENEKGYQKISLFLKEIIKDKQFWTGKWTVINSLDQKKYNLKTIAYNEFGTYEKMSFWIDPNPGHDLSSIGVDQNLDMGSFGINLGGITKTAWSTNLSEITVDQNLDMGIYGINLGGVTETSWPVPSAIPSGVITMWYGSIASIPAGWQLCNGSGGTPDLRARFIRGAPAGFDPGTTGGSDTHTLNVNEMPSHNHDTPRIVICSRDYPYSMTACLSGITTTGNRGGDQPHNNMPAYYEVAFICKI
ncbi:MAG: hypothetical protein P1P85_04445 [Patescibacteria group bacterium]|nr:hypothetical protein [Patescibacteria group bacterium]